MPSNFYDLIKYAKTGIDAPSMSNLDKIRALSLAGGYPLSTITGVPPLTFRADGRPLTAWSMLGNGQQTGTPTPDAPIYPEFVGERTKNLLDNQMLAEVNRNGVKYTKNADGSVKMFGTASPSVSFCILMGDGATTDSIGGYATPIFKAGEQIIFSTGTTELLRIRFTDGSYSNASDITPNVPITVRKDIGLVYAQVNNGVTINKTIYPMIRRADISGSKYEPYGYKLPLTCGSQTMPVYLGQVQTVRRIKKLVLTGLETVYENQSGDNKYFSTANSDSKITGVENCVCSHFVATTVYTATTNTGFLVSSNDIRFRPADVSTMSADHFKTFLQQQYQNGTPVTVWYVLAEPKTAIVNEPLCKIGNYVDELHSEDAGVIIPTTRGQNVLTVGTDLQPSSVSITGHIKLT